MKVKEPFIVDLFILDSQIGVKENYNWEAFDNAKILGDIYNVKSNLEINRVDKKNKWFFVLYDDEEIDEQLACSLQAFELLDFDILKFYKKEKNYSYSICPRMFKSDVILPEFGFLPTKWKVLNMETCLNGWIYAI